MRRSVYLGGGAANPVYKKIQMGREVLGLVEGDPREVDHRDRNPLNNQKENLRATTHMKNASNRDRVKFPGVRRWGAGWRTDVTINGQRIRHAFPTREQALAVVNRLRDTQLED